MRHRATTPLVGGCVHHLQHRTYNGDGVVQLGEYTFLGCRVYDDSHLKEDECLRSDVKYKRNPLLLGRVLQTSIYEKDVD